MTYDKRGARSFKYERAYALGRSDVLTELEIVVLAMENQDAAVPLYTFLSQQRSKQTKRSMGGL